MGSLDTQFNIAGTAPHLSLWAICHLRAEFVALIWEVINALAGSLCCWKPSAPPRTATIHFSCRCTSRGNMWNVTSWLGGAARLLWHPTARQKSRLSPNQVEHNYNKEARCGIHLHENKTEILALRYATSWPQCSLQEHPIRWDGIGAVQNSITQAERHIKFIYGTDSAFRGHNNDIRLFSGTQNFAGQSL